MTKKGEKHKKETIKKISDSRKGQPAWNVGLPHGEITKEKISISKKRLFNFIQDKKIRGILTRDYAFAEICKKQEMFKPAIVLYGSIIEEILREILGSEKPFSELIVEARQKDFVKPPLARKIDFVRDFRNYVHIFLEIDEDFDPTEDIASVASEVCKSLIKIANKN